MARVDRRQFGAVAYASRSLIPPSMQAIAAVQYAAGLEPKDLAVWESELYANPAAVPAYLVKVGVVLYTTSAVVPADMKKVAFVQLTPPIDATDTFQRADSSSSLGTASDGTHAWAVGNAGDLATTPTWGVLGNKGYMPVAGNQADPHAFVVSSKSDTTVTCDVTVHTAASAAVAGILFRRSNSTNYFAAYLDNSTQTVVLIRNLAGTRTVLGSAPILLADGQVVSLQAVLSGSAISILAGSVTYITTTDGNLTTAVRHGLYSSAAGAARFDNFSVL